MMMREVKKEVFEKEPYQVWNAFIDLLAMESYENLTEIQRKAHLVFWYDSEVGNGGHLQYFENQGTDHLTETIKALKELKAISQAEILEKAGKQYKSKERKKIISVLSFVKKAREGEYDEFDNEFYESSPALHEILSDYLEMHQEQFVKIV